AIHSAAALWLICPLTRSFRVIALPHPFAPARRRLPQSSNNAASFPITASFDHDIDRAPSAPAANHSPPSATVAPVSRGPCSPKPARAPPSAIADQRISAETTPLRHWIPPDWWSAFSPLPGSTTIAVAILLSAPATPPPLRVHFWNLTKNYFPLPPALEPALCSLLKSSPLISDLRFQI